MDDGVVADHACHVPPHQRLERGEHRRERPGIFGVGERDLDRAKVRLDDVRIVRLGELARDQSRAQIRMPLRRRLDGR